MADHHHGYLWLGSAFEFLKDGPRRPEHPEFPTTKVTPLETAHWLLKPARFIDATFDNPHAAAEWFSAKMREHTTCDAATITRTAEGVADTVRRGQDAVGGWYLTGRRFLSLCLVGCSPHRLRPHYACPLST